MPCDPAVLLVGPHPRKAFMYVYGRTDRMPTEEQIDQYSTHGVSCSSQIRELRAQDHAVRLVILTLNGKSKS